MTLLGDGTAVSVQGIYDHAIRITDAIDAHRDILSAAMDLHLSAQSNRMNQSVRTLTSASIVLMSMALIAGIYGMNFEHMPELTWRYGYVAALGLIVVVGLVVAWGFRRKNWW